MATPSAHRSQAEHNEQFLAASFDLSATPYLDWAATAIFYAGLHYLRALMSKHGFANVTKYAHMDAAFERLAVFKHQVAVHNAYRHLKDDSRAARYDFWMPTQSAIVAMRDTHLRTIREFILPKL